MTPRDRAERVGRPTAAKGGFPYPHRTQEEIVFAHAAEVMTLDALSRRRALTHAESLRLERLLRRVA